MEQLSFCDIPLPVLEDVGRVEEGLVLAFVCHPLHGRVQGKGKVNEIRSEILQWHPCKFNGKLDKVNKGDRGEVRETAGHVAHISTRFTRESVTFNPVCMRLRVPWKDMMLKNTPSSFNPVLGR